MAKIKRKRKNKRNKKVVDFKVGEAS